VKTSFYPSLIPAIDWIRRLGRDTGAFRVVKITESITTRVEGKPIDWNYVVTIKTRPSGHRLKLFVASKLEFSPQTALTYLRLNKSLPPDGLLLLCASYISPRVAELCLEHKANYLDSVGNCRLVAPGIYISVSTSATRPWPIKLRVDPFAAKSSRIVRALLTHPEREWQVQELAQVADVSIGLVSKVKRTLIEEAYLEERGRLLRARDAAKLLQDWAAKYRPRVQTLQLFAIGRPAETESRFAEWCQEKKIAYGFTQLAGAWRYAPMVRYDRSVSYVDKKIASDANLKSLFKQIDARQVDSGANFTLWITDDPSVFVDSREFDGIKCVSPIQLYLNLMALPGRGEEAAREVLSKHLPAMLPSNTRESKKSRGSTP